MVVLGMLEPNDPQKGGTVNPVKTSSHCYRAKFGRSVSPFGSPGSRHFRLWAWLTLRNLPSQLVILPNLVALRQTVCKCIGIPLARQKWQSACTVSR